MRWRTVAAHEWRSVWADRTALVVVLALVTTVTYAVLHGAATLAREQSTVEEFRRTEAQEFARQRRQNAATWARIDRGEIRELGEWDNDPTMTPLYSLWEFRLERSAVYPDSPLAFLATGQRDMYPMGYQPDAPGQFFKETLPSAEQNDNPIHRMVGHFDLAFVVVYLLPLFVVAMSYDLFASERESGILPLVLSQPIALRTILLAKVGVRAGVILFGMLLAILATTATVGIDWHQAGVPLRFLSWLAASVVYGAVWFGIALIVNARGKSAAANAVALAVCWLVLTLLIPAANRFVAKTVHPVPPRSALRDAKRDANMKVGIDMWEEGVKELDDPSSRTSRIVARYLADNPDLRIADLPLPGQTFTFRFFEDIRNTSPQWHWRIHQQRFHLVYSARTAEIGRLIAVEQERFDRQYRRQHDLFAYLSYLSPQTLVERIFTSLSGTTAAQHDRFLSQVEAVHEQWRHYFTRRSLISDMLRPEDFERFPVFVFQPEGVTASLMRVVAPVAALLVMAGVLNILGFLRMRRFPIIG